MCPASRYRPSRHAFPETLLQPEYQASDQIRRVGVRGYVQWQGQKVPLSLAFAGLDVALRPTATDGVWSLHFMRFNLGCIDTRATKTILTTVRDVSEHPSSISPV